MGCGKVRGTSEECSTVGDPGQATVADNVPVGACSSSKGGDPSPQGADPAEAIVAPQAAVAEPSAADSAEVRVLRRLIVRQSERMLGILEELEANGRKVSHWAWWVFPTDMPGAGEPGGTTYVTPGTAGTLLADACAEDWRKVLEKVCDLCEDGLGISALPRVDHGRVHFFLKFWASVPDKPVWMESVLQRLNVFDWPPR